MARAECTAPNIDLLASAVHSCASPHTHTTRTSDCIITAWRTKVSGAGRGGSPHVGIYQNKNNPVIFKAHSNLFLFYLSFPINKGLFSVFYTVKCVTFTLLERPRHPKLD